VNGRASRIAWAVAILVALAAASLVLVRTATPSLDTLAAIDISWTLVAAASLVWYLSFLYLIVNWVRSLDWWNQRLPIFGGIDIFFMSNLARYIPGAVWQFAGLAAMSTRRGISPLAATAAILIQQLVLLLTGGIIAIVAAPRLLGEWTSAIHPVGLVAVAVAGLAALVSALPWLLRRAQPLIERRLRGHVTLPRPTTGQLAANVGRTTAVWVGYGVAFWLLGRALYGVDAPTLFDASIAFIGASVLGIAAIFAPGGIIIREVAMAGALAPAIGLERATVLAIASRVWMIALEILGALAVLAAKRLLGRATPG
jgi:hypothetical protein